ncbi:hypothetical protein RHSIM_Rhsim13G0181500 [Rhododendron simsii]|uniref:OPA3-like protein n=1 Tax=Rhododendron simsii TaxID=118357 RepID=A0A834G0F8_RHOSS|nr:hypothetical protein RHSIM_Rhsim13G0181500 [Rhododendron simsii]
MVLPFLKLGTLVLKTLSKPIAGRLKKEAGLHPKFRQLIVRMAQLSKAVGVLGSPVNKAAVFGDKIFGPQANHRLTTTMQRRIYGHATDVEIRPLNEEKAVQAAVDLIGELFVFSVAGVALIFEVQRSSRSEAKKEELRKQEMEVLPVGAGVIDLGLYSMVILNLIFQILALKSDLIVSPIHPFSSCKLSMDIWRRISLADPQGLRLRDEQLAGEVEHLKQKLEEIEQLARARGIAGVFNLRQAPAEDSKSGKKLA